MAMKNDRCYTTTDLIQIIETERSACLRGERVHLNDRPPTGNPAIDYFLSQEGIQRYTAFQNFQGAIHNYQQQYGVSGLIWDTIIFQDSPLQYPKIAPYLIALPADLQVLKNYLPIILDFWQKAIVGLDLYCTFSGKHYQRIQPEETIVLLGKALWASLTLWSSSTRSDFLEFILDVYSSPASIERKAIELQNCTPLSLHAVSPGTYPIG
jgi:hypothetical protein